MSFVSQSWTPFEVVTSTKMNQNGDNDDALHDGTGIIGLYENLLTTHSNPYKFSVYRNAAANTGNAAAAKVVFDTEVFDTNNNFASGTYTVPVNGFYLFDSYIALQPSSNNLFLSIYKNGSEHRRGGRIKVSADNCGVTIGCLVQCTAGDTIEIYAYGSATTALDISATNNWFTGFLMSKT